MITSVANEREAPYLRCSQVTFVPSSNVDPGRNVNFHVFALLLGTPVFVARSATISVPAAPGTAL